MAFSKTFKWTVGIIICIGIILAIVLPVCSLKSLDPTEVGLDYSTTSVSLDESQLYSAGRHFIGVAHEFVVYNTQYQRIELDNITCRSLDGLNIQISAGFQYSLKNTLSDILDLFYLWPWAAYQSGYENIAINIFRDVIANFTAFDFVYNRTIVESSLVTNIMTSLQDYHATIQNFQLLDVEFPSSFSSAISDTQNANLSIQAAMYNQTTVQNQVDGTIKKAQTDSIVIINNANISATITQQKSDAEVLSTLARINTQLDSLKYMKTSLNLSADAIISYEWLKSVQAINERGGMKMNLKTPKFIQCLHDGQGSCS